MKTSSRQKSIGKIIRRQKNMPAADYDELLFAQLQDLDFAAGYLTACLEEGEDVFFLGIRNVARAQGGMKALAEAAKLNRESLYDMLSTSGNPLFSSVTTVLDKLGLEVSVKSKASKARM